MALTPTQEKWAVGGTIAVVLLVAGYGLFHRRSAHAGLLPVGHPDQGRHAHRKKSRRPEDRDEHQRDNERGEYGGKKKHHHREHKHD